MKTSLLLTAFILVGTVFVALWQKGQAGTLEAEYSTLRTEVSRLGIDPETLSGERGGLSQMRQNQVLARIDAIDTKAARDARTGAFAKEIIEFAAQQKNKEGKGRPGTEDQQKIMALMEGLLELKADDFKVLLEAFKSDSSVTGEMRQELVGMAVMTLGQQNPKSALDLLAQSGDELMQGGHSGLMVGMCLQGLAQKDPVAALAWIDTHKELVNEDALRQTLQGVAAKNPELAMKRMLEGGGNGIRQIASSMTNGITDPAARENLLATMRKITDGSQAGPGAEGSPDAHNQAAELRSGVLMGIGTRLTEGSFEESKAWLESGTLNAAEKETVMDGVADSLHSKNPAPWLEWMSSNLPEEKLAPRINQIIRAWTNQDFNAVGAWLNAQPAGPARETATMSFAETLIPHEPEAAARWLESLPDSPRRTELLQQVTAPAAPPAPGEEIPADSAEPAPPQGP